MGFSRAQGGGSSGFARAQGTGGGFAPAQGAGSVAAFAPDDVAGLVRWYDANDLTTLWQDSARTTPVTVTTDPVGAWDDKGSDGVNALQATAGLRPTYVTSQFGSLPGINFVAASSQYLSAVCTQAQPVTWFVVVDQDVAADQNHYIDGVAGRQTIYAISSTFRAFAGADLTGAATDTSPHVLVAKFNGASSELHVDGGAGVEGNAGANALDVLNIARESSGAVFFDGRIAEILGYSSALSLANINLVGAYLASKWGTTWTTAT